MKKVLGFLIAAVLIVTGAALLFPAEEATIPVEYGYGPNPILPPPKPTWFPTTNIAKAAPWPEGMKPTVAQGLSVNEFAKGLDHPRWLHLLPNGDVLVAESNKPSKKDQGFSLRGFIMGIFQGQAGANVASANRISLLRDADGDGVAEIKTTFLKNLNSPFGMSLLNGKLYVANTDAILAFPYQEGAVEITAPGEKIADLPAGPINHHWTKDVIASNDGTKLYATVGSNSNVGENGMENEVNRAAVLEIDLHTRKVRLFAWGLRNPNGLSWHPESGELWVAVNERDEIGSDLVPDYMTSVRDGAFYGWPYSYFGRIVDNRPQPLRLDLVSKSIPPDYALGSHTASLGLTFNGKDRFGAAFKKGAFVGQHGSWNRKPRSGYKVIFIPFSGGKPSGPPQDILTGFLSKNDEAYGRPVGVTIDKSGALLIADDVGNKVWRVVPSG